MKIFARNLRASLWLFPILLAVAAVWFFEATSFLHPLASLAGLGFLGFCLVRLQPKKDQLVTSNLGVSGASFVTGFLLLATLILLQLFGLGKVTLERESITLAILNTSLIFFLISASLKPFALPKKPNFKPSKELLAPVLLLLFFALLYAVNPFAQDNDTFLSKTIAYFNGTEATTFHLRPIFGLTQAAVAHLSSINPLTLYPLFPIVLFWAGALVAWDYFGRKPLALALLVAAPVIATEILTTRPQVILLAYALPLFCLLIHAAKRASYSLIAGIIISTLLVPFHELSAVFLLLFLGVAAYHLVVGLFVTKTISWKHFFFGLLIAVPYFLLLPFDIVFRQLIGVSAFGASSFSGFAWNWWFIDSYKSVDGVQLGWPGLQAGLYYLFNGLPLYALGIYMFMRRSRKDGLQKSLIPVGIYVGIFVFFAEIAPRFGFTFLLNRTWPYIALGTALLCFAALPGFMKRRREATAVIVVAAILGGAGSFLVARDNVGQVFAEERAGISFLKDQTPADALILSNQGNETLIELFANRQYSKVEGTDIQNRDALPAFITGLVANLNLVGHQQVTVTTTEVTLDGVLTSKVQEQVITPIIEPLDPAFTPHAVYYLFSKRKAGGRNGERNGQYSANALTENQQVSSDIGEIVFEDDAMIIVKLR